MTSFIVSPSRFSVYKAAGALCLLVLLLPGTALAIEPDPEYAEHLQERIRSIQSEGGAYDVGLIEARSDLAAYYRDIGDHVEAASLYSDVWQSSRISQGLYSEQQLQVLPLLIASLEKLEEWEQVDDYRYLLFHTQSRLHEPGSQAQVAAVRDWGDWKLRAWREGLIDVGSTSSYGTPADLNELRSLYDDTLPQSGADAGSEDVHLDLLYGRTLTDLEIARHVTRLPARAFSANAPRYVNRRVCRNVTDQSGNTERICWTERMENPNWRSSLRDEQRRAMDRARFRASRSAEDLQAFLDDRESLDPELREQYRGRIEAIDEELSVLQRQARRALLRTW